MAPNPQADRFLRACARLPVDCTPIWMMRQAGRSLPAYRELRNRYSFKEVAGAPELCAEVTIMPVDELGVDAAIIFADIMTPVVCLGIDYEIVEGVGPRVGDPISSIEQVEKLDHIPPAELLPELFEAMRLVVKHLDGKVPLIGFAGAPFTLASYLIEGGPNRELPRTRALMLDEPVAWGGLMERMVAVLVAYLEQQVEAGIQAFQIFDSWVGSLTPDEYRKHVLPHSTRIFSETAPLGVPRIHFGTGTAPLLELMAAPQPEVVGVDWTVDLAEAWERIGADKAIQGNLDPRVLLSDGATVVQGAHKVLASAGGQLGHIFNLGHGVLPETPLENLKLLVETVHGHPL